MQLNIKGVDVDFGEPPTWRKSTRSGPWTDNCVEVAFGPNGYIALRDSKDPDGAVLGFNAGEWDAFIDGAKDGEFDV